MGDFRSYEAAADALDVAMQGAFLRVVREGIPRQAPLHGDSRAGTRREHAVYMIEAAGFEGVKVGSASSLRVRLRNLQAGCPVPLAIHSAWRFESVRGQGHWVSWAPLVERAIHGALDAAGFARTSPTSEWFHVEPDLLWCAVVDGLAFVPELCDALLHLPEASRG